MATENVEYTPPRTVRAFIMDYRPGQLFYDWIVGPLGSGKTTGLFMKLAYMAKLQERGYDGVRRSRAVIVRSTMPQLRDTTMKSWFAWFKDGIAGKWFATEKNFLLKFDDVECEVLFRPLDTPEDVDRVLSLEVTFAIIDEFIQIPRAIIDALSGRCGRYPAKKDGGATNWGMWGSSNPGTEDNWWYDYLHNKGEYADGNSKVELIELFGTPERVVQVQEKLKYVSQVGNVRYFHQPSGNCSDAENIENLPGGREYYFNQAKGKSAAWIKQFLDAEWGFSASEQPVVQAFLPNVHVSSGLRYMPTLQLVGGFDPGLGGMALIFGQEDLHGRLCVLGELGAVGMGVSRFITDKIKPYMRQRFPNAELTIAPDPAAANRQQNDERAVVDVLRKAFQVKIETNNHLAVRLDAIEHYASRLTEIGPALLIDKEACPQLVRALSGGWRYQKVKSGENKPVPDKNSYSHYGDAFGYLCRYFHKQFIREGRHGGLANGVMPFTGRAPVRQALPVYHNR